MDFKRQVIQDIGTCKARLDALEKYAELLPSESKILQEIARKVSDINSELGELNAQAQTMGIDPSTIGNPLGHTKVPDIPTDDSDMKIYSMQRTAKNVTLDTYTAASQTATQANDDGKGGM